MPSFITSLFRPFFLRCCVLAILLQVSVGDVCGQISLLDSLQNALNAKCTSVRSTVLLDSIAGLLVSSYDAYRLSMKPETEGESKYLTLGHGIVGNKKGNYGKVIFSFLNIENDRGSNSILFDGCVFEELSFAYLHATTVPQVWNSKLDLLFFDTDGIFVEEKSPFFMSRGNTIGHLIIFNDHKNTYGHRSETKGKNAIVAYHFVNDTIDCLEIKGLAHRQDSKIDIRLVNSQIQTLLFDSVPTNLKLVSNVKLSPATFIANNGNVMDTIVKLSELIMVKPDSTCLIKFNKPLSDKWIFNYRYYKLDQASVDSCFVDSSDAVNFMYENLIAMQEEQGYKEGQKKLDIEYKDFQLRNYWRLDLFFSKHWWNYGYDKERIFLWTARFFLLFLLINLVLWRYFYRTVYSIEVLKPFIEPGYGENPGKLNRLFYYMLGSLFYSFLIFFGVKLDVSNFRMKRNIVSVISVAYLYTFYIIGIVCLVFIANYVLLK